jgi:hypothetical protein
VNSFLYADYHFGIGCAPGMTSVSQQGTDTAEGEEVEINVQRFDVEIVPDAGPVNAQLAITEGLCAIDEITVVWRSYDVRFRVFLRFKSSVDDWHYWSDAVVIGVSGGWRPLCVVSE